MNTKCFFSVRDILLSAWVSFQFLCKGFLLFISTFYSIDATSQVSEKDIFQEANIPASLSSQAAVRFSDVLQEFILEGKSTSGGNGPISLMGIVKGNFLLTCRISGNSAGSGGWMLMDTSNNLFFSLTRTDAGLLLLKSSSGLIPNQAERLGRKVFEYIQIERTGAKLIISASLPGEPLSLLYEHSFADIPEEMKLGMFLEVSNSKPSTLIFSEVRLDKPVQEPYDARRSGIPGSRLEILDLKSGVRKVIYESTERFEAPNFMPDGKQLLFNMKGLLYTIPMEGGMPKIFDTGAARRNNNDHGISFDGKLLALSSHRDGLPGGGSSVYVMPLTGGEPTLITQETPSYWHGWNPNNREVLYVAQRHGSKRYQIYSKDIFGGAEKALTFFDVGHVDGPEFSPEGKFIYYNGSQTGKMQIWRMDPDGKNLSRLTMDEYNNWFPHISPDGKSMVFLSYLPDIDPDAHPAYKKVMLRMMAAGGGPAKVLAHLYGGQGTINVPSWSPDGRYIAFVSNSR